MNYIKKKQFYLISVNLHLSYQVKRAQKLIKKTYTMHKYDKFNLKNKILTRQRKNI